jgi:hypothetical protein
MGNRLSQLNEDVVHPWQQNKLDMVEAKIKNNLDNPRFVRWWELKYEVQNPVEMSVE